MRGLGLRGARGERKRVKEVARRLLVHITSIVTYHY
jgi:hypothetical protein